MIMNKSCKEKQREELIFQIRQAAEDIDIIKIVST